MATFQDNIIRFVDIVKKSGLPENASIEFMRRIWLMKILSFIGIINLVPLGINSLMSGNIVLGSVDLFMAFVLAGNYILAVRTRNYPRALYFGVIFILIFYMYLLVSGGSVGTGHLWLYTFPLIATYLLGYRRSVWANLILITLVVLYFVFGGYFRFGIEYSYEFELRFIPSFLVVFLFSYLFEKTREKSAVELSWKHEELEKTVSSLHEREDELHKIHGQLERKVAERTEQLTESNSLLKIEVVERKRMAEELEESLLNVEQEKTKTEAIIAAMGIGVSIQDRNFKVLYQNQVHIDMIGDHCNEFCYVGYEGNNQVCIDCPVEKSFQDGRIHMAVRHVKMIEGERYFEITASPLKEPSGTITAGIELVQDISGRKQMEQEVLKVRNLESIGVLAGGIGHDFNNIMMSIFGNIELALLELPGNREAGLLLNEALAASKQAVQLSALLRTFSKGGKPYQQVSWVADLIKDAGSLALKDSKTKCSIEIPDDLWLVVVDRGQLGQVFYNLLINAKEAMSGKGTITVTAENRILEDDTHSLSGGRYIQIKMSDTGGGIVPDIMPQIFDPYFSTKEMGTQKGMGMGLSICHSIVDRHSGAISVSTTDQGATFRMLLPAVQEDADISELSAPIVEIEEKHPTGRILVMDDDKMVRRTSGMMLNSMGFQVEFAVNGHETLNVYKKALSQGAPFDAVILDLSIPGEMGGEETIVRLREIDPSVKAIVASGYTDDPVISDYNQYGFRASLTKPFTLKNLERVLLQILGE